MRVGFQKGILRSATGVFSIPFKDTGARITLPNGWPTTAGHRAAIWHQTKTPPPSVPPTYGLPGGRWCPKPLETLRVAKAGWAGRRLLGPGHAPLVPPRPHARSADEDPPTCRLKTRGGQDGVAKAWSRLPPRRLTRVYDQPGTRPRMAGKVMPPLPPWRPWCNNADAKHRQHAQITAKWPTS